MDIESLAQYKEQLAAAGNTLVVVDFHATWCGPCKQIAPRLKALVAEHEVILLKVDVDDADDVAKEEKISAMPTFFFYKVGNKFHVKVSHNKL